MSSSTFQVFDIIRYLEDKFIFFVSPTITDINTTPVRPAGAFVYDLSSDVFWVSNGDNWYLLSQSTLPAPILSIANLTTTGGEMLYTTGVNTYNTTSISTQGRSLVAAIDQNSGQAVLGLIIGIDVQEYSSGLTAFANVSSSASSNTIAYFTGVDSIGVTGFTAAARSLLSNSTIADMQTTLSIIPQIGSSTNNAVVRWNGTGGDTIKNSSVIVDDSGNISGIDDISLTGNIDGITPAIRSQLVNIGSTTIASGNWVYLSNMNQNVSSTSTPTFAGITSTSTINAGSNRLINLATPTLGTDATTKNYVDGVAGAGITPLEAVQLGTAAILPNAPTYASPAETLTSSVNANLIVDGVATAGGERILVKDQADNKENGIYTVTQAGSGVLPWILTRASDFNQAATPISQNSFVLVEASGGTANDGTQWTLQSTLNNIDPLTDAVVWNQFGIGQVDYTGGNGINITGTVIRVDPTSDFTFTGSQLAINAPISVANGGTGNTTLTSGNVLLGNGVGAITHSKAAPTGDFVGTTDVQALTNKTITAVTNTIRATQLGTTGADVVINTAGAPSAGQVLTATSAVAANWQTPGVVYSRYLTVAQSGGDYTSIVTAITAASALTPTVINPVIVLVYPGTYTETNPIVMPGYVTLMSVGGERTCPSGSVVVTGTSTSTSIFQLSANSSIIGITAYGASSSGGIGFSYPHDAGNGYAQVQNCYAIDCAMGIQNTGLGGLEVSNSFATLSTTYAGVSATGIASLGGGNTLLFTCGCLPTNSTPNFAVGILSQGTYLGVGSKIIGFSVFLRYCTIAVKSTGGGTDPNECGLRLTSGQIIGSITTAVQVEANAIVELYGIHIQDSGTYDLNMTAATSKFLAVGSTLREDKVNVANSSSTVTGVVASLTPGDVGVNVYGQLSVGSINNPAESIFGGGDSHTRGMRVFRANLTGAPASDDGTNFVEITSSVTLPNDGSTAAAFASTSVNEVLYIAQDTFSSSFPGLKILTTTGIVPTGGVSQPTYYLGFEYWNGSAWVAIGNTGIATTSLPGNVMSTDSNSPYAPYAVQTFRLGSCQVRFGKMTGWTQKVIAASGIGSSFWMRFRILSIITTIPVLDQIKLHTNRTEINADGFTEYFGNARSVRTTYFDWNLFNDQTGSTGDVAVYASTVLLRKMEENVYRSGNIDEVRFTMCLPEEIDTSFPIKLKVRWFNEAAGGTVIWQIRYGWTSDASDAAVATYANVYQSAGASPATGPNEVTLSTVTNTVNATVNKQQTTIYYIPVNKLIAFRSGGSGDILWFELARLGTTDTNSGDIDVINMQILYVAWSDGKHLTLY